MSDNFASRLSIAIARSGKPKGDLASHCGVALSTVSRWLNGAIPKPATLVSIADFLEVDARWLLGDTDEPQFSIESFLAAMASENQTLERERHAKNLAMETTDEFLARMEACRHATSSFFDRCSALCEAANAATTEGRVPENLGADAIELLKQSPELERNIKRTLSEAAMLRHFAESSPELLKILRSV